MGFTLVLMACSASSKNDDDQSPNLAAQVEGVYKINNISGTAISNPSYNVLVNIQSKTSITMREVINNATNNFQDVPLTDAGANRIEFAQMNGTGSIQGFFLNGVLEYTLVSGNTSKTVKARR